jgi:hypothetical protein
MPTATREASMKLVGSGTAVTVMTAVGRLIRESTLVNVGLSFRTLS